MSDADTIGAMPAPADAPGEALRTLRSQLNLRWFNGEPAQRMLSVVSGTRGEGRSFIAAHLAVTMSQLGKRTLLIDADLRNPSQHRLFGVNAGAGLAAMLVNGTERDNIQSIAAQPDLSLLAAGAASINPADLLGRPTFAQWLSVLSARFDAIVLDTPAADEYADAQIIAAASGAALIVARSNVSRIARVRALAESLAQGHATVLGTVLNDASR